MYQLKVNIGSRVRNIHKHSVNYGKSGFIEREVLGVKPSKWLVRYNDGSCGTYFKHTAHRSLQVVDEYKSVKQTIKEQQKEERIMIKRERRNVITGWTQSELMKRHGNAMGVVQFNQRALGKTTGQAMAVIGSAMVQPYVPVSFHNIDHAIFEHNIPTQVANANMRDMIKDLINTLGFKGFRFNNNNNTIVFNPIVTEENYVESV
ncbi:hypothetical protein ACQ39_gp05 [Proteus phage PM 85]|uniref:Uncharacterized protein n=1 Tax=Proteus phage PM 85 TaxID=1560283 RepID=A0A0F6NYI5_9CAUD|nr:hypothetical protein ACQ39_gp05 [Proteus phage PM 85]AIW03113.1 hypothetical protein PM85_005 [Proteus phage PM 85]